MDVQMKNIRSLPRWSRKLLDHEASHSRYIPRTRINQPFRTWKRSIHVPISPGTRSRNTTSTSRSAQTLADGLDGRLSARAEPCPRVTRHVRYVKPCNNIPSMARRRIAAARGLSPAWGVARACVAAMESSASRATEQLYSSKIFVNR